MNEETYDMIEHVIDNAFQGNLNFKFYEFLKANKIKKHEIDAFNESSVAAEISDLTLQLEEYIKGGADDEHKQLREAYGFISKPQARKIKEYLYGILLDGWRYSSDKRPGRRRKSSK